MKNKAFAFSVASSIFITLFMLFINYTTSPGFPWFIYPVFAVLWWPMGVYFAQHKSARGMSLAGGGLSIIFFIAVNLTTSPGFLWCIFPIFAVLWWPMSVFLGRKPKIFTIAGSTLIILFFLIVNLMTSFAHPWFIYPAFAVIWWPLAVLIGKGKYKLFSVLGTLLIAGFFITVNYVTSPQYPWFIHILYPVLWWPLSAFIAKKKTIKIYSLIASLMTITYLVLSNLLFPGSELWFIYAVFPLLLWPVIMYAGRHAASLMFALAGSIIGIGFYLVLNIFLSPGHPWILYLILPFLWWPVSIAFKSVAKNIMFLFISITIFAVYYGLLNIFISPGSPWSLYLLYPYAWAVIGMYFGTRRMALGLAVAATLITAAFCSILNFVHTPNTIWAVFPVFAILWWPMSIYFFKTRKYKKAA